MALRPSGHMATLMDIYIHGLYRPGQGGGGALTL